MQVRSIAKVDKNTGKVTPVKAGKAKVIVKSAANNDWKAGRAEGTVTVKKGSPTITASDKTIPANKTTGLGAKITSGAGKLTYKSSSTAIAKIDSAGRITPVRAGRVTITISADENANWYSVRKYVKVTINKVGQPLTVSASSKTVKYSAVRSREMTVSALSVSNAQGKVTYAKSAGSSCLNVNPSNGKITVKKGTKKGTYTVKVKVTAAGNVKFNAGSKAVVVTVYVK